MTPYVAESGVQIAARGGRKNSRNVQTDSYDFYEEHQCCPLTDSLGLTVPFSLQPAAGVSHTPATEENLSVSINSEFTNTPWFLLQQNYTMPYPSFGKVFLKMQWLITPFVRQQFLQTTLIQFLSCPSSDKTFPMLKRKVCSWWLTYLCERLRTSEFWSVPPPRDEEVSPGSHGLAFCLTLFSMVSKGMNGRYTLY